MAGRFLSLVRTVDAWLIARTEDVLLFLNEWLSISWAQTSVALIAFKFIGEGYYDLHSHRWGLIFVDALYAGWQFLIHTEPETTRVARLRGYEWSSLRVSMMLISVMMWIGIMFPPRVPSLWIVCAALTSVGVWFIVIACGEAGIRGRKRKAAMSKIKELFGTEWIPDSVQIPS